MDAMLLTGTIKDGIIVPDTQDSLPEGAQVRILVQGDEPYAGFWEEFAVWDRLSEEAWGMIEELERGEET